MKRRSFIKTMAAASSMSLISPAKLLAASKKKMLVGIQLYTIRDLVSADFQGTLEKLAAIGYNSIEAAGYSDGKFYGFKPTAYKKRLEDLGMKPLSSHTGLTPDNVEEVAEHTLEAGMSYLVLPWIAKERRSLDGYKKLAEDLNIMGERCNNAGLRFAYHNHDFEFFETEGVIPYNLLLDETQASLVTMQLDLYWIVYAGFDPVTYFATHPGRFELWHVKDLAKGEEKVSTEIGSGIVDFKTLFSKKKQAGFKHYFLEQEHFSMDPMKSLEISYNYLKQY